METPDRIGHVLVLEHAQDENENGKHIDSGKHIKVHEGECCTRQGLQRC